MLTRLKIYVQKDLQLKIDMVQEWTVINKMYINTKTKCMVFGSVLAKLVLKLNNVVIKQVQQTKQLGVIIDSGLKFDKHIEYNCGKARRSLNKISYTLKGRFGLPVEIGVELY